jgi:KRAB domain-containing zinc finger protein
MTLLSHHKRMAHGEKKVPCDFCGKLFFDKIRLTQHLRVHTKERPFTCDICGKLFSQKDNLNTHKKLHTENTKHSELAKPHVCGCGKAFTYKNSLDTHKIEVHLKNPLVKGEYVCDVCERPFASIGRLKRHKMTHTGEKPHSCDVCGRAFVLKSNLNAHKKIHSKAS